MVAEVGIPPHQLVAVFQSVLINPIQVPIVQDAVPTFKIPVAVAKKAGLMKVALDVVPPKDPFGWFAPPSVRVLAEEVKVPRLASTPLLIDIFDAIVVAIPKVFVPELESTKLLNVVTDVPPMD